MTISEQVLRTDEADDGLGVVSTIPLFFGFKAQSVASVASLLRAKRTLRQISHNVAHSSW